MARQEDAERRALADFGVDIDEAAGLLDDAVDGGEAEPGALADLLGREERLEDLVDDVGGMPVPVSVDLDPARSPPPACPCRRAARLPRPSTLAVRTVSLPPSGMASRALTARLTITCSNCETSTLTGQRSRPCTRSSLTFSPISRRSSMVRSDSASPRSSTCGRKRLPAREGQQLPHQRRGAGRRSA